MKSLSLARPHALIMVGIPGSGKSQFARKFSETFQAPLLSLEQLMPHCQSPQAAAELLQHLLSEFAKTQASLLVEGASSTRAGRTELMRQLRAHGYTPLLVWVQTDHDTAQQRSIRAKRHDKTSFDAVLKQFSPPHQSEQPLVISGKHTYSSQAKIVLKRLSSDARPEKAVEPAPRRSRGNIVVR